ncbi:TetR family transcriptional regulator [Arthrobacter sp. N1]|uniref:TetR family transcriptional regulator n=1 Tax=Arthrobacter sp. N1 TaxID=619291 RepID=UPI003BAFEB2E
MYSVPDSATTTEPGLRERKRLQTRSALVSEARALTLENGLTGFTVDQLCERVGISRRTFFNYFPAKEDAVLGHSEDGRPEEALLESFLASGGAEPPVPLLEALTLLFSDFGDRMAISREEYRTLSAVLQREPQLLARMFARAEAKAQLLTDVIVEREGLPADHPMPRVATFVLGGLARRSLDEFFAEGNTHTYATVFRRNIDALRHLFPLQPIENQDPA